MIDLLGRGRSQVARWGVGAYRCVPDAVRGGELGVREQDFEGQDRGYGPWRC